MTFFTGLDLMMHNVQLSPKNHLPLRDQINIVRKRKDIINIIQICDKDDKRFRWIVKMCHYLKSDVLHGFLRKGWNQI